MVLSLQSVSYRYAGSPTLAIADVALDLGSGEVVGAVGAGESGKSTLCLVAAGLAPGTIGGIRLGRVLIDGRPTTDTAASELAERCGIMFQDPANQLSGTAPTVWEEIAFGPRNLSLPLEDVIERTETALEAMGIRALAARDPAGLSGGQAQLVALAGVLALRPGHLILDEPTAQLDPQGTDLVAEAIVRLASSGASILIAEQRTDLLERVCDRVVVLAGGRVVMEGPTADVLGDPRLPELGVAEPSAVRLRRIAREAGVDPARLEVGAA